MAKMHEWVNDNSPYINATNLNEMEQGIASGCTYMATCNSAASAVAKSMLITDFEESVLMASPGIPFVLYVLFTNGSTSDTMTISVNSSTARNVRYRNSANGLSNMAIAANDVVAFVYNNGIFYMLGAITKALTLLAVTNGGTGRSSLTLNSVLVGNGTSEVKQIGSASGALYATGPNGDPQFGPLPVAQGGTGATDAANARDNIGVPTFYSGTTAPSSDLGKDGDVYFQYTA